MKSYSVTLELYDSIPSIILLYVFFLFGAQYISSNFNHNLIHGDGGDEKERPWTNIFSKIRGECSTDDVNSP